jgi:hypothetical protein
VQVGLVIPAWRRYAVTRLCLAQKQQLVAALAARGITCHVVVVADDENLDIAAGFGFETVEQENVLGRKVNDGFEYACERGADYVGFVGSDDWLHENAFDHLDDSRVCAGHRIAVVDLERDGRLRRLGVGGPQGVPPWLIPRRALERSGCRPADDARTWGMEGSIVRGLGPVDWRFDDPHDLVRVDFKSDVNMTPYGRITGLLGYGPEETAWPQLAEKYPADLVALAERTSLMLQPVAA